MKRVFYSVYRILPHLTMITALMLITLVTVDHYNRAMAFLDNQLTKTVFFIFLILVLVQSVLTVAVNRLLLSSDQSNNGGANEAHTENGESLLHEKEKSQK